MTATLRRPALVGVVVAATLVFGWWHLLWQPQTAALADARRQEQQESTNLYQAGQRLGHLKHLAATSAQMTSLDKRLTAAVPSGDDLDGFLLALNAVAQSSGVEVQSISPSPPAAGTGSPGAVAPGVASGALPSGASAPLGPGAGAAPQGAARLTPISVTMSVNGSYFAVQRLLDALRSGERLIVIDSLNEAPGADKGDSSVVSASITAHLLSGLAPAPAPGGGGAPAPRVAPAGGAAGAAAGSAMAPGRSAAPGSSTRPPTTAGSGIISGPVGKARTVVTAQNNASDQTNAATGVVR